MIGVISATIDGVLMFEQTFYSKKDRHQFTYDYPLMSKSDYYTIRPAFKSYRPKKKAISVADWEYVAARMHTEAYTLSVMLDRTPFAIYTMKREIRKKQKADAEKKND